MSFPWFSKLQTTAASFVMGVSLAACGGGGDEGTTASNNPAAVSADQVSTTATATGAVVLSTTIGPGASSGGQAAPTPVTTTKASSSHSSLGLNLSNFSPYSQDTPTYDLMKRSGYWMTQCASYLNAGCKGFAAGGSEWDTKEQALLNLDADGWVRSLPAANDPTTKYRSVMTTVASGGIPAGNYTVLYDGSGTITYFGVVVKQAGLSKPGRDVVTIADPEKGGFFLSITATDPNNYIRNIRILPPGGACANDFTTFAATASECGGAKGAFVAFENFPKNAGPWHPAYVKDLRNFRTLRFMDWGQTNTTTMTSWAQRPLQSNRTWGGPNGAPVESMFALAGLLGADPWINLPPMADDDYVRQFARLARQSLSAGQTLNLEYANEAWNYNFTPSHWMLDQGKALWPNEVAKGTNVYLLQANWYAKRLVETCKIVKAEFGAQASQVRCILGAQAAVTSITEMELKCTIAAVGLGQPCSKSIDVLAIAPYFGHYLSGAQYRPTVLGWYGDADGGLGKVFNEILPAPGAIAPLGSLTGFNEGALGMSRVWMAANQQLAAKYGLPMWAYEAGQHLVPAPNETDDKMLNLMIAANRDARMGAAYTRYFADWQAAGGQTMVLYAYTAKPSKWGIWGLKENQFDNNNPKWLATVKQRDQVRCWWQGC